jgi:hypothetical protein
VAVAGPALANPKTAIQGEWGLEKFGDMNCASNPALIPHLDGRIVFKWPKSVNYADGAVHDDVSFAILAVEGETLSLRRERDGVAATITVAADGASFLYYESEPEAGSIFERCTKLSS